MSDSEDHEDGLDLFTDPPDYYPPSPKPTTVTYTLLSGLTLSLRLVGHNPLWGHHLWNAGRLIAHYLESHSALLTSPSPKTVLELGAGAGLPSLVCAILGAQKVVVTDYPDAELISNLQHNIDNCPLLPASPDARNEKLVAKGYLWGADPTHLLAHLPRTPSSTPSTSSTQGFDILILADLLFNHSEHGKLVRTLQLCLSRSTSSVALVFFTPYRPWLLEADLAFFDLCREAGFIVEKILEEKMEEVMFEEDRGDEEIRRTVFGYEVKWAVARKE